MSLEAILEAREARWQRRLELAQGLGAAVVSVTLNIPGPDKNPPGADQAMDRVLERLDAALAERGAALLRQERRVSADGPEAYTATDLPARELKLLCVELEHEGPLGRLADLDVMGPDGAPVGRADLGLAPRPCLICGKPAMACIRSRAHPLDEVLARVRELLRPYA